MAMLGNITHFESDPKLMAMVSTEKTFPLPSGYVKITIENGPFIVDLPMKNGDCP